MLRNMVSSPSQIQCLEDLLCYLIVRDSWGMWVVEGPPRSGKTNGAMYWAEVTRAAGLFKDDMQATNVHMLDGHTSHLKLITTLTELRAWCEANKKNRKMMILDEAAKSFPKRTPMAKDNIEMLKEIQTLGHMRFYLILITQDPARLLEGGLLNPTYCQGRLLFLSSEWKGSYRYIDNWRPRDLNYSDTGYPRTSIPYDPHHVSVFQREGKAVAAVIKNNEKMEAYRRHRQDKLALNVVGLHPQEAARCRETIENWAFGLMAKDALSLKPLSEADHKSLSSQMEVHADAESDN